MALRQTAELKAALQNIISPRRARHSRYIHATTRWAHASCGHVSKMATHPAPQVRSPPSAAMLSSSSSPPLSHQGQVHHLGKKSMSGRPFATQRKQLHLSVLHLPSFYCMGALRSDHISREPVRETPLALRLLLSGNACPMQPPDRKSVV